MIRGIGTDLADIKRLKKIISGKTGKRFVENTFTENEIGYAGSNIHKLATAFAAKEAVFKALGSGWLEGKEVEILRNSDGVPEVVLYGETKKIAGKKKIKKVMVSLSYSDCCAMAVAVIC